MPESSLKTSLKTFVLPTKNIDFFKGLVDEWLDHENSQGRTIRMEKDWNETDISLQEGKWILTISYKVSQNE